MERDLARDLAWELRGFYRGRYGDLVKVFPQSHFYREAADRFIRLFKIKPEKSYRLSGNYYSRHSGDIKDVVANIFCDREKKRNIYVHSGTWKAIESDRRSTQWNAFSVLGCIFYTKDKDKLELLVRLYRTIDTGAYK